MLYFKRLKKDFYLRQQFLKHEIIVWKLKGIIKNKILPLRIRIKNRELLNLLVKKHSIYQTRILHRCILTGRSRGVLKEFGLSRIMFKKLADNGEIFSLQKL